MGKKRCLILYVFAICLLTAIILPSLASTSFAETYNLTFATFRPPTDAFAEPWLIPMAKELEKRSDGRVKMTIYWAEALGKGRDQFRMVKDGVADVTDFPGVWMPGKFTLSEVASLPMAAEDPLNVVRAMSMVAEKGYFDKQWGEVKVMGWVATTNLNLLFRKNKPETLEEMAGLKARAAGGYISEFIEALGMVPVQVLPPDAYMAWQTGIVDVWVHPITAIVKYKFTELPTKALLDMNLGVLGNSAMIMNKKKFASLPPDLQKVVSEVLAEYSEVYVKEALKCDKANVKVVKKAGIDIYKLSKAETAKIKAKALPIWEKYIADMEKQGLPGREVANEFVKALKKLGEEPPYSIK
ncbi:MAG: TRAP transporter substrate-binding protein DctP [Deltaproteobacteria bacterium]|nr:TRAP transporter substrate-binding protein DctP [Deltaproteobacteria bacterium]